MPKERLGYPNAAQIAGNPKEAAQYIRQLVRENDKLRTALGTFACLGRNALRPGDFNRARRALGWIGRNRSPVDSRDTTAMRRKAAKRAAKMTHEDARQLLAELRERNLDAPLWPHGRDCICSECVPPGTSMAH